MKYYAVVYQMGKVASTSIVDTLGSFDHIEAVQSHFLGDKALVAVIPSITDPDISDYFFRNYESYGGMILGTNIAEAHYGMSRGLIDLSRKMKLGYAGVATSSGAGGLAVAVGMLFRCTKFDGTIEMHHIASVE